MLVRLLLVVTLALLTLGPTEGRAQARPTPAMVAAAMLPCVTNDGRIPVEMRATVVGAEFWEYPEHTMRSPGELVAELYHAERNQTARQAGLLAYLSEDEDPSPTPLLLDTWPKRREDIPTDARFRYIDCFYAAYRP